MGLGVLTLKKESTQPQVDWSALARRPWEAPEHVLEDAGVELGSNYPYPIISAEDSEAALARAAEVIQQSIVSHNSGVVRPKTLAKAFSWDPCHGVMG